MSPNELPPGSFSHTGFTGTYVLGVPKYGLSIVLLTNRQNLGTDARGYFPDVGPLQAAVARAIVAGAEPDSRRVPGDLLRRGDRVRVLAPAAGVPWPAEARLDSLSDDTVFLRRMSEPPSMRLLARVAIPTASVARLEVPYSGKSRWDHARVGALVGLGAYLLAATAWIVHEEATCTGPECFGEGFAWIGLVDGVPTSAAIGAGIGFVLPVRHWREIRILRPQ
jgi:hypothetical protein